MYFASATLITNFFLLLFTLTAYASSSPATNNETNSAILQSYVDQYLAEKASNRGEFPEHNCLGSLRCKFYSHSYLQDIAIGIMGIPRGAAFSSGQHIMCAGQLCAFLQKTETSFWAHEIKYLIAMLVTNCNKNACGSVASEPSFKLADGELTVNWVYDLDTVLWNQTDQAGYAGSINLTAEGLAGGGETGGAQGITAE